MSSVRVLVADDEHLIRAALRIFLDHADGIELVADAADGERAVALTMEHDPDVVLMDLSMPVKTGIDATAAIVAQGSHARVLVLSSLATDRRVVEALRAGASGYLLKDTAPENLIAAIRDVVAGEFVLSPQLVRLLAAEVRGATELRTRGSSALTPRELSVVQLLAEGMSNAEIAASLHLAESTVKANLGRITVKWSVRDRVQLLIQAVRLGVVRLPDPE